MSFIEEMPSDANEESIDTVLSKIDGRNREESKQMVPVFKRTGGSEE